MTSPRTRPPPLPTTCPGRSDLLLLERRRQRLLQLFCLGLVFHDEGVEVPTAADLELGRGAVLLDLHGRGVLAAGNLQELPDLRDLFRHRSGEFGSRRSDWGGRGLDTET